MLWYIVVTTLEGVIVMVDVRHRYRTSTLTTQLSTAIGANVFEGD